MQSLAGRGGGRVRGLDRADPASPARPRGVGGVSFARPAARQLRSLAPPSVLHVPRDGRLHAPDEGYDKEPIASTSGEGTVWDHAGWMEGYASQPDEHAYWVSHVTGEIPKELVGTYFRNGPGMFQKGDDWLRHPFDGDGLVCSVSFRDQRAYFRSRYVRTEGYEKEREEGRVMYRNTFGTQRPGGLMANLFDVSQKNVANTSVMLWGGKLLALWEAMQPYELDPRTLETKGVNFLGGLLRPGLPFTTGFKPADRALRALGLSVGGLPLSAHPHTDPGTGRVVQFGYELRPEGRGARGLGLQTRFQFWEFSADGSRVEAERDYSISGYGFLHDFMVTEDYYVMVQNPVDLDVMPFVVGAKCPVDCLTYRGDRRTKVHLIPRPGGGGGEARVVEIDPCFIFHHINSYQRDDGSLVMDVVQYDRLPVFSTQVPGDCGALEQCSWEGQAENRVWRHVIDPDAALPVSSQQLSPRVMEFPTSDPRRAGRRLRYGYMAAARHPSRNGPWQCVAKIDLETGQEWVWDNGSRTFASEPQFIARPGGTEEDDGWVVCTVYDAAMGVSEVVVLDARRVDGPALAVLHLKQHVPYGIHGMWTPDYYGEEPHAPPP